MGKFRSLWVCFACLLVLLCSGMNALAQDRASRDNRDAQRSRYKVLHNFQGQPDANGDFDPLLIQGLVADAHGNIYGESQHGGPVVCIPIAGVCFFVDLGTEFKLDRHGDSTLFPNPTSFVGPLGGSLGPMLLDTQGNLVFATVGGGTNGIGGVFSLNPQTGDFTNLFDLTGPPVDGEFAAVDVIRDSAGNLYGTTLVGGFNPNESGICKVLTPGCGTVYKLDAKTNQETVLHAFTFDDGFQPVGIALDKAGNVIGAAMIGGPDNGCKNGKELLACGLIFKIDPSGNFSVVHEFHHNPTCPFIIPCPPGFLPPPSPGPAPELQGWIPEFVTVDEDGNIFGIAGAGGIFGLGGIFKIDSTGQYSVLHHFAGPGDGFVTEQILLKDGKLYGINQEGGNTLDCDFGNNGCGTIFRLDTRTGEYKVLHTFSKNDQGTTPTALAFDQNGDLIGANLFGGIGSFDTTICTGGGGCGNIFRLKLSEHGDDDE